MRYLYLLIFTNTKYSILCQGNYSANNLSSKFAQIPHPGIYKNKRSGIKPDP